MPEDPLKPLETFDPDLLKAVRQGAEFALADRALPRKVKFLIAMAIDAAHGASGGVASLARAAMGAGATRQEVAEALRVAHFVAGAGATYTAARGLAEIR